MACERRVWRYEECDHEELLDIRCSLASDPGTSWDNSTLSLICLIHRAGHIHNTVVVESATRPRCSICNQPAPIDQDVARTLTEAATARHLPPPGSHLHSFRGVDAEDLNSRNEATLDGASVNGASHHGRATISDTMRNVPERRHTPGVVAHNQGSPSREEQEEESSQPEGSRNTEQ